MIEVNTDARTQVEQGLALPVMEHFYTVQGEGANNGLAAYFVRLGGCDVGCHWCDVKESWEAANHPVFAVDKIVDLVKESNCPQVVITGGEPAMYPLELLTQSLQDAGIKTWIETSGAHELTGQWHWICFSPKKFKAPVPSIYAQAHELKVVIFHRSDFAWAEEHAVKVNGDCELYLQPEWSKRETIMPLIVDYVKKHPQWRISLQTHKYMDIP